MNAAILSLMDSAEDHLPDGQRIETKAVIRLRKFSMAVMNSVAQNGYSRMAVITGPAGIGKTIAIQAFVDEFQARSYNGLPPVIKVKVKPDSTPKALALDIGMRLGEKAKGRNRYELADEVAISIKRNELKMLIVDEADRLNEASFDLLRHIYDVTWCPVVLVGLPSIWRIIDRHEKFVSRIGMKMQFPQLTKNEMFEVVLPQLVLPGWSYNAADEGAREIGERIFQMVGTSFRKLRMLLQAASQIAIDSASSKITLPDIEEAFEWTYQGRGAAADDQAGTVETAIGEKERISEMRHAARQRKIK